MESKKKYRNSLVIFVDMLGTQSKRDINSLYSDYSIFHSALLEKDNKYINDGRSESILSGEKIRIHVHSFSDCAYVLYTYENESLNSESDKGLLIDNALCHFERIILKLLEEAIVFRGGVSYGEVFYEKDKNILFGPAVNEAFRLEDTDAKNPRILVSTDVADAYNRHYQQCVEKFDHPSTDMEKYMRDILRSEGIENLKESQGRIIIEDNFDGKYIFNYLNSVNTVDYIGIPEIETFTGDFKEDLYKFTLGKLNEKEIQENPKVREKYEWLINYILA